ncbi:MAG: LptF/LptG family permease [Holosporales bacterium]|jgi:lipopolysaccharide export system permease protein|nr:LptF/LptG family permease [Holosporales bacterium]
MPFNILFRYIFKKLLTSFCIITPIVVMMIWVSISVRYVELIASDGITITMLFKLIACLLPGMIGVILPMCTLIATIACLHKMRNDNELIIIMTSTGNEINILSPIIVFSLLVSMAEFHLQTVISPHAYGRFETIQKKVKGQISMSIVKTRTFNVIGSSVIYIGDRKRSSLEDVFISYIPKEENQNANVNIITAKKGTMYVDKNESYFIMLEEGCRQELKRDNTVVSSLKFKNFSYDITPFLKRFHYSTNKPGTKTQAELMRTVATTSDPEFKRNCLSEYHYRILSPFIVIINAMIVILLMMRPEERGRGRFGALKCLSLGTLTQICFLIAKNVTTRSSNFTVINYIATGIVIAILGAHLVRRNYK